MSFTTRAHIEMHPTGQSIGMVAGGAGVYVTGEGAIEVSQATPITKQGEETVTPVVEGGVATAAIEHGVWVMVPDSATSFVLTPAAASTYVKTMHVDVPGTAKPTLATGSITWLGGEPTFTPGDRYTIVVRQIGTDVLAFIEVHFSLS